MYVCQCLRMSVCIYRDARTEGPACKQRPGGCGRPGLQREAPLAAPGAGADQTRDTVLKASLQSYHAWKTHNPL